MRLFPIRLFKKNKKKSGPSSDGKKRLRSKNETKIKEDSPVRRVAPAPVPPPEQAAVPVPGQESSCRREELPEDYGENMIYLLIRDPYSIYAYWEIQKDIQEEHLARLGGNWDTVVQVLRVYDITETKKQAPFYDIVLQNGLKAWYLNAQPGRNYVVEIGLLHHDGRFLELAHSNEVTMPRAEMSEVLDEQWMSVDFDKMYALSGGLEAGKSSAELRKLMEERLQGAISSGSGGGAISSMASPVRIEKRGFQFWLECELIIYGGAEPGARVRMQGRPVSLRPDGTFTLRYALPDGQFTFDCRAGSPDGTEEKVIIPNISRCTERPAPVLNDNPGLAAKSPVPAEVMVPTPVLSELLR